MTGDPGRPVARPVASSNDPRSGTSPAPQGASGAGQPRSSSSRSVPLGRRRLARLAVELSDRDKDLLRLVDEHRLLSARQVERFCFRGHASDLAAARSARRTLLRLHRAGLLAHLERRVGGIRAGSAGYVWHLTTAGQRLLHPDRVHRPHEPSARLLAHTLAIGDTHLALRDATDSDVFELLRVDLEPVCWRRYLGRGSHPCVVKPDLYVVTGTSEYEDHWFVEVDLGTEHPGTVLKQCRAYLDYRATGQEQHRLGVFPRVVWQVPDQARAERLDAGLRHARLDQTVFRITTPDRLVDVIAGGAG